VAYYDKVFDKLQQPVMKELWDNEEDEIWNDLKRNLGKAKTKTPIKEEREIRKKAGKKFAKKFGINLD